MAIAAIMAEAADPGFFFFVQGEVMGIRKVNVHSDVRTRCCVQLPHRPYDHDDGREKKNR